MKACANSQCRRHEGQCAVRQSDCFAVQYRLFRASAKLSPHPRGLRRRTDKHQFEAHFPSLLPITKVTRHRRGLGFCRHLYVLPSNFSPHQRLKLLEVQPSRRDAWSRGLHKHPDFWIENAPKPRHAAMNWNCRPVPDWVNGILELRWPGGNYLIGNTSISTHTHKHTHT